MSSRILVEIRNVYGRKLIYPANDMAQVWCDLLNQKAFTPDQIELLKKLGALVEIKQHTL